MSGDAIRIKTILVDIQENGIIRDARTGYLIARLVDGVEFETIRDNSDSNDDHDR